MTKARVKRKLPSGADLERLNGVYSWEEIARAIGVKHTIDAIAIYRGAIRKMQRYLIGKTELREDLKDSIWLLYNERASAEPAIFKGSINIKRVVRK